MMYDAVNRSSVIALCKAFALNCKSEEHNADGLDRKLYYAGGEAAARSIIEGVKHLQAAEVIEALTAENERLRKAVLKYEDELGILDTLPLVDQREVQQEREKKLARLAGMLELERWAENEQGGW